MLINCYEAACTHHSMLINCYEVACTLELWIQQNSSIYNFVLNIVFMFKNLLNIIINLSKNAATKEDYGLKPLNLNHVSTFEFLVK